MQEEVAHSKENTRSCRTGVGVSVLRYLTTLLWPLKHGEEEALRLCVSVLHSIILESKLSSLYKFSLSLSKSL